MIGKSIGHYTILRRLGEGGMAEVYLARDEKLGRKIGLKAPSMARSIDDKEFPV